MDFFRCSAHRTDKVMVMADFPLTAMKTKLHLETLKNNGFKYTKKREALLTYLVKRNRYVSAKEVFDYMNQEFKGVSYDTTYGFLSLFRTPYR